MSRFPMTLKLLLALVAGLILGLTACTPKTPDTGILVIAVEGLKAEDLSCIAGEDAELRGFNFLCQNFLNIQGVVANSTSSASNLASLLTGMPPEKHGLRVNDDSVAAGHALLSEKLALRGWRTSLFSGGAPLLRRTHLNQGFETFDESVPLAPKLPFRSFEASTAPLFSWVNEAKHSRHFAIITASDLMFPEYASTSDKGELRPRSIEGQIEELDESLFHLFEELQKRGDWEKWWVVVIGLSGRPEAIDRRPPALQVNPPAMLVPMYVHAPESITFKESRIRGVWSFSEIGEFLQEIANEVDTATQRTAEEQGRFFIEKLRDREAGFATAEGCIRSIDRELFCRTAFFDNVAWFTWEPPLRLDVPGRKELLAKVQKATERKRPEAITFPPAPPVTLSALEICMAEFSNETPTTAFVRACPSKAIQSLRNLYQQRQTLLARPESLRDQKLRFFHEWAQLAAAHQLYLKFDPTRLFNNLETHASNEYLTIQKILERPELRDLQREALRSLPPGIKGI